MRLRHLMAKSPPPRHGTFTLINTSLQQFRCRAWTIQKQGPSWPIQATHLQAKRDGDACKGRGKSITFLGATHSLHIQAQLTPREVGGGVPTLLREPPGRPPLRVVALSARIGCGMQPREPRRVVSASSPPETPTPSCDCDATRSEKRARNLPWKRDQVAISRLLKSPTRSRTVSQADAASLKYGCSQVVSGIFCKRDEQIVAMQLLPSKRSKSRSRMGSQIAEA